MSRVPQPLRVLPRARRRRPRDPRQPQRAALRPHDSGRSRGSSPLHDADPTGQTSSQAGDILARQVTCAGTQAHHRGCWRCATTAACFAAASFDGACARHPTSPVPTARAGGTRATAVSAAPETLSASRRLVALGAVALAAFGIALAARESGALAPLEREALKARFDVRGAEPVKGMLVVGIDAKTFGELQQALAVPALPARPGRARAARRGRARDRLRRPVHRADASARGPRPLRRHRRRRAAPCWPRARATTDGSTNVLGGDDNLRSIGARAAASDLRNDTSGAIASFPRAAGKLDSIAVVTAERLQRAPAARGRLPRRQGLDRLPRPARDDPDRLVRGRERGARARRA